MEKTTEILGRLTEGELYAIASAMQRMRDDLAAEHPWPARFYAAVLAPVVEEHARRQSPEYRSEQERELEDMAGIEAGPDFECGWTGRCSENPTTTVRRRKLKNL